MSSPKISTQTETTMYGNLINPICISEAAKLYEQPDSNSAVLQVLNFGTPLKAKRAQRQVSEINSVRVDPNTGHTYQHKQYVSQSWYQAFLPGIEGYIKGSDVASHSYTDHNRQIVYFVLTDQSKHNARGARICIYDRRNNTFIDSLQIKNRWISVVKFIDKVKWSNVNMLIRASKVSAECGGSGGSVFIADVNGTLTEVISSDYANDDGDIVLSTSTTVSLPVETESGEFRMIETAELPGDFEGTVLENRPIVKKFKTEKAMFDTDQQPLLDSAGNPKWESSVREEFYQWSGHNLKRIND